MDRNQLMQIVEPMMTAFKLEIAKKRWEAPLKPK